MIRANDATWIRVHLSFGLAFNPMKQLLQLKGLRKQNLCSAEGEFV